MLATKQFSQQSGYIASSSLELYAWKTGKNPSLLLFPNNNNNNNRTTFSILKPNCSGTSAENFVPLDIDVPVDSIACGDAHMMLISDGKLYGVGENSDGRLGISKRNVRNSPTPLLVSALSSFRVLKVACGSRHTIALVEPGNIFAWGYGKDGQLGLRNDLTQYSPQHVHLGRTDLFSYTEEPVDVVDISCGANHTGVVSRAGDIYMFGSGELGQLGNGKKANELLPYKIKLPNEKAEKIACGRFHTLVLTNRGSVYGFGLNSQGQLGLGHKKNCDVPHKIPALDKYKIMKLQAGAHSAGISYMGELYVWGPCILGECLVPQRVGKNMDSSVADVQIGNNFTSILDYKGYLWGLGAVKRGELGLDGVEARTAACPIVFLRTKKIKNVVCAKDVAIILAETRCQVGENNLPIKARSLSPKSRELSASRSNQRSMEMQHSIRGRLYSPQPSSLGVNNLSGIARGSRENAQRYSAGYDPRQRELSFSKNSHLHGNIDGKEDDFSGEGEYQKQYQPRPYELEKESRGGSRERDKKAVYRVMNMESDSQEPVPRAEIADQEGEKIIRSFDRTGVKDVSNISRNVTTSVPFDDTKIEFAMTKESEDNTPIYIKSREKTPQKQKDRISLVDVMNEVESFDLEESEEGSLNSQEKYIRKENDSGADKRENDSRISDLIGDIKNWKMKSSFLENQIEEKAKEIALLESKVEEIESLANDDPKEKKPMIPLGNIETQIRGLKRSYRNESSIKGIQTDVSFQDESPKSCLKDKDSALMDSLIQENKNLKGLVSYLVQSKGNKYEEEVLFDNQKPQGNIPSQMRFRTPNQSQGEEHEFGSEPENTLDIKNLKNSFGSWHNKNITKDDSFHASNREKNSIRTSPIGGFVIAPPPGYKKASTPKSPKSKKEKKSKSRSVTPDDVKVLRLKKIVKSNSMCLDLEEERQKQKSLKLRKTKSVVINEPSVDESLSPKRTKSKSKKLKQKSPLRRAATVDSLKLKQRAASEKSLDSLPSPKKAKSKNTLKRAATVALSLKGNSMIISGRSLTSIESPKSAKKTRPKSPLKRAATTEPSFKFKSKAATELSLDSLPSPKKAKGKRSLQRATTLELSLENEAKKTKKKKNTLKRAATLNPSTKSLQSFTDESPVKKKKKNTLKLLMTVKKSFKALKPVGNLKPDAPVKETKSTSNGKKALMVTFQKNIGEAGDKVKKTLKLEKTKTSSSKDIPSKSSLQNRTESPIPSRSYLSNKVSTPKANKSKKKSEATESSIQDISIFKGKADDITAILPNPKTKQKDSQTKSYESIDITPVKVPKTENESKRKAAVVNLVLTPSKPVKQQQSTSSTKSKALERILGPGSKSPQKKQVKSKNSIKLVSKTTVSDFGEYVDER